MSIFKNLFEEKDIEYCSKLIGLAHTINEARHEPVCPLSIGEVWVFWDPKTPLPYALKLGVMLLPRPMGMKEYVSALSDKEKVQISQEFIIEGLSALSIDKKLSRQWLLELRLMANQKKHNPIDQRVGVRLYKDSRSMDMDSCVLRKMKSMLWSIRKGTLRNQTVSSAYLFKELTHSVLRQSFKRLGRALTMQEGASIGQIVIAQQLGLDKAGEILKEAQLWSSDQERREFGYDMSCRELSEQLMSFESVEEAHSCIAAFFELLGSHNTWADMGAAGEQEILFDALCHIEASIRTKIGLK